MNKVIRLSISSIIMTISISVSAEDNLIMDGTSVIGNSEMPNVLYVVPWKQTPQPNLNPELHESLIDDQLRPIDREIFLKRINHYHRDK